jgi:uncharacterized protein
VTRSDDYEVRNSRIHGLGVFARRAVPARCKIGELTGELISIAEARRRAFGKNVVTIVEFDDDKALDAADDPCLRFVNHSCEPNTYMRRIGHRVEFYAARRIARGEELTCDYGETHHEGTLPCRCGAARCREKI